MQKRNIKWSILFAAEIRYISLASHRHNRFCFKYNKWSQWVDYSSNSMLTIFSRVVIWQVLFSSKIQTRKRRHCARIFIKKITKTARFTIIRHSTYKINDIYSKASREGLSKVTKIMKFTKTEKFTIIHHTSYNINEMYSKSCRADPSKVTKIAKITKLTKTAKLNEIRKTIDKINEI